MECVIDSNEVVPESDPEGEVELAQESSTSNSSVGALADSGTAQEEVKGDNLVRIKA